ncbi:MAG: hypothetical protein WBG71_04720 [Leeuwenhoekiella sp.]
MELIVKSTNQQLLKKVEDFANQLGLDTAVNTRLESEGSVVSEDAKLKSRELVALMRKKAEAGGVTSISDAGAWQKEIRKDKKLIGR